MQREKFHQLLKNYVQGNCTDEEKQIIEQWYELIDNEDFQIPLEHEMNATELKLWSSIQQRTQLQPAVLKKSKVTPLFLKWAAAAVTIGIAIVSFILWRDYRTNKTDIVYKLNGAHLKRSNTSSIDLKISLADGSTVILKPQSTLTYPNPFDKSKREVYIDGEAFFLVKKNSSQPFFVYCQNIITRVVGTSFSVKKEKNGKVEVEVATGIVSVYERDKEYLENPIDNTSGVVLTANQKVTYYSENKHFITTLVSNPKPNIADLPIDSTKDGDYFLFQDSPLSLVLKRLESVYNIKFIVENENLLNCPFTGNIHEEDLYTKLQLVCQATTASFEIQGTQILIKGDGCN